MAKQSSYQKLKAKIAEQQTQIYKLRNFIADDDFARLQTIKHEVLIERQFDNAVWQGSSSESTSKDGILSLIQPAGVKRIPAKNKCDCGSPGKKKHFCPLKQEVEGDDYTLCNCCDECENQCAQDV